MMLAELENDMWANEGPYKQLARQHHFPEASKDDPNDHGMNAIKYAILVQQIDPDGREGYEMEYRLRVQFASSRENGLTRLRPDSLPAAAGLGVRFWQIKTNETDPDYLRYQKERKEQYHWAADALEKYNPRNNPRDPTDSRLYYQLAEALYRADLSDEAKRYAIDALKLAEVNKHPTRTLTKEQKKHLRKRLGIEGSN